MALVGNTDCHGLQPIQSMASVNQLQANKHKLTDVNMDMSSAQQKLKHFDPTQTNPHEPVEATVLTQARSSQQLATEVCYTRQSKLIYQIKHWYVRQGWKPVGSTKYRLPVGSGRIDVRLGDWCVSGTRTKRDRHNRLKLTRDVFSWTELKCGNVDLIDVYQHNMYTAVFPVWHGKV